MEHDELDIYDLLAETPSHVTNDKLYFWKKSAVRAAAGIPQEPCKICPGNLLIKQCDRTTHYYREGHIPWFCHREWICLDHWTFYGSRAGLKKHIEEDHCKGLFEQTPGVLRVLKHRTQTELLGDLLQRITKVYPFLTPDELLFKITGRQATSEESPSEYIRDRPDRVTQIIDYICRGNPNLSNLGQISIDIEEDTEWYKLEERLFIRCDDQLALWEKMNHLILNSASARSREATPLRDEHPSPY